MIKAKKGMFTQTQNVNKKKIVIGKRKRILPNLNTLIGLLTDKILREKVSRVWALESERV